MQRTGRTRPAVSVVVPTCAQVDSLERTVVSLLETRYEPLEILVVENRPPAPGTRRVVEERFSGRGVRYLEEPRRGASWARNTGLAHAEGDLVAFTDDDVVVERGWIENAVAAFDAAEHVACVTGRILPLVLATQSQVHFDQFAAFDKGARRQVFRLPESHAADPLFPYAAGHVGSGANIFIRRDVALALGGFDPLLGPGTPTLGGEDLDMFVRLAQSGRTIVYDPAVILRHEHPNGSRMLRRHAYHYGIGLTAMLGKHLVRGPARLKLLRAVPRGMHYGLSPDSRKNALKSSDFPRALELLERVGMLLGPGAYLLSLTGSSMRKLLRGAPRGFRRRRAGRRAGA